MKIRWGLVGCGDISNKRVAPAIVDLGNSELVSIARADFSKAEQFAKKFGAKKWFKDWQDLVADDDIDAVYIATPVNLHAEQAIAAAEAGKHVLCEKPMAMDTAECDRMIDACKAANVNLGVAYYRHFYPAVNMINEILQSGQIGLPAYTLIKVHEMFNPKPGQPRRWLVEKEYAAGGPMMDVGSHRIELLLNLFGPISEAKGMLTNGVYERSVEDTGLATFSFESGCAASLATCHASVFPQDTVDVFGCKGTIKVSSLNEGRMTIIDSSGEREEHHPPHANVHQPHIEDFANAVIKNVEPAVTGEMGREVTRILDLIYGR
jgi:predicted dehydrogenase